MQTLDRGGKGIHGKDTVEEGLTEEQVTSALSVEGSVAARDHPGGPAPSATARGDRSCTGKA